MLSPGRSDMGLSTRLQRPFFAEHITVSRSASFVPHSYARELLLMPSPTVDRLLMFFLDLTIWAC